MSKILILISILAGSIGAYANCNIGVVGAYKSGDSRAEKLIKEVLPEFRIITLSRRNMNSIKDNQISIEQMDLYIERNAELGKNSRHAENENIYYTIYSPEKDKLEKSKKLATLKRVLDKPTSYACQNDEALTCFFEFVGDEIGELFTNYSTVKYDQNLEDFRQNIIDYCSQ
jgi:hypothetical protein